MYEDQIIGLMRKLDEAILSSGLFRGPDRKRRLEAERLASLIVDAVRKTPEEAVDFGGATTA